jgi:hypothetical protein
LKWASKQAWMGLVVLGVELDVDSFVSLLIKTQVNRIKDKDLEMVNVHTRIGDINGFKNIVLT